MTKVIEKQLEDTRRGSGDPQPADDAGISPQGRSSSGNASDVSAASMIPTHVRDQLHRSEFASQGPPRCLQP